MSEARLPVMTSMRSVPRALAALVDFREHGERSAEPAIASGATYSDAAAAMSLLDGARHLILPEWRAREVLSQFGIGSGSAGRLARTEAEAVAVARSLGTPVALKVQSPHLPHKTEAGALALGVSGERAVTEAYARILANARQAVPTAEIDGVLVQPMAPPGTEMIVGTRRDQAFGPMIVVGLGGIHVEVLKDSAFALAPVDGVAARMLLGRLRARALLDGVRGAPPTDVDALIELMVQLSEAAACLSSRVEEIDLNPVLVHPRGQGVTVVDALIVRTPLRG